MSGAPETWPAADRNKAPIAAVLREVLPARAQVLEVASGTGQHAAYFAEHLDIERYQPTDCDLEHHRSITAWTAHLPNVLPARELDVTADPWPIGGSEYDAIYCANMIHIAPFDACLGLLRGAGRHLRASGYLVVYGPFMLDGVHTSQSNADFDARLKERDLRWGVRDLAIVQRRAEEYGLTLERRVPMPANNQTVVFRR